jgi:hypothetical protein
MFDRNEGNYQENIWNGHQNLDTKGAPISTSLSSNCRRTKSDMSYSVETPGMVPYLGTFLTELAMLDQGNLDLNPGFSICIL